MSKLVFSLCLATCSSFAIAAAPPGEGKATPAKQVAVHAAPTEPVPITTSGADFDSGFPKGAVWRPIGGGYAGCEGPQWIAEKDSLTLYYAAQHDHLAFKWTEKGGLKTWRNDSPEATSFRPDGAGGYYVVEQSNRRLVRWNAEGKVSEVLADKFEGKLLNRPNDVIARSDGTLWFTDPDFLFKVRPSGKKELDGQYVFRLDPKSRTLTAVARDLVLPNGIAFSPDEKSLFVTDSGSPNVFRWPVEADGKLGARNTFASFNEKGLDGLAFDPSGRLWCATKDGIRVIAADGKVLGLIKTPAKPTAFAFAPAPSKMVCLTVHNAAYVSELK